MKTREKLQSGSRISYVYLIIAVIIFWKFFDGIGDVSQIINNNWLCVVLSLMYIVHWFYGTIHYPRVYKKLLNPDDFKSWRGYSSDDFSGIRAMVTAPLVIILAAIKTNWPDVAQEFVLIFIALCLLWLVLHWQLRNWTRTNHLFKESTIAVDCIYSFPEIFKDIGKDQRVNIFGLWWDRTSRFTYYYSTLLTASELNDWKETKIKAYINSKKVWVDKMKDLKAEEDNEDRKITDMTKKVK